MATLWQSGHLSELLDGLIRHVVELIERLPEDEVMARSTEDLTSDLARLALVVPITVSAEPIDGEVTETTVDVSHDFLWHGDRARGFSVSAVYEFTGDPRLFKYQPSTYQLTTHEAVVGDGTITVRAVRPGLNLTAADMQPMLKSQIDSIRTMAGYAARDAESHNGRVETQVKAAVEARKERIRRRRDLAGALGFPLQRRADAPRSIPMQRKQIGTARPARKPAEPYRDEPALTTQQYEDAIGVVRSTLLAMERTPSVASGKGEEDLRDQILVQLNGTFTGGATGETFVQSGKTDILVKVDDRHVFVGECKWWTGSKDCSEAVDQLLSYLPWRDEKAALILFIDRKDASAAIERADEAIRGHRCFKRIGPSSDNQSARRNYVLGHPDDPDREIHTAALFAVLPKDV